MMQTPNYKLNKPEMSDPFSPAPLSENADKVDAALGDHETRVVKLENCRIVAGVYPGNDADTRDFDLGERPLAVLVSNFIVHNASLVAGDIVLKTSGSPPLYNQLLLTDSGFRTGRAHNDKNQSYSFLAFLGGWEEQNFPKDNI